MTEPKQLSTKPLPMPKVFQLSPQLSEELKKIVGDIEWVVFLKPGGDFVSIAVPNDNPLIQISGCTGVVELLKPSSDATYPEQAILNELSPACECSENAQIIQDLLVPKTHDRYIAISYAANNDCLNIDGHRYYG